ncbi:hypothetical protein H5410_024781, partial [Solanum commersonii]
MTPNRSIVTPTTGIPQRLLRITFGSYLPPGDEESAISNAETSTHQTPNAESTRHDCSNGKALIFVTPCMKNGRVTVMIGEDDIKVQMKNWETTGTDEGYDIFNFKLVTYKEGVLNILPYYYNHKPVILKQWELDFQFNKETLSLIPIWVKFPVGYWSVEALTKVTSTACRVVHTYQYTTNSVKISYAKILIKVDVSQPFTEVIQIETNAGMWEQHVDYEWKPKYCNECLRYGHTDVECWYQNQDKGN